MTYNRFDVVLVHFPFSEKQGQKKRPAIVLTAQDFNERHAHALCAMVTTASNTKWETDMPVQAYIEAELRTPCVVRMKWFTVAAMLILGRVGTLQPEDQASLRRACMALL